MSSQVVDGGEAEESRGGSETTDSQAPNGIQPRDAGAVSSSVAISSVSMLSQSSGKYLDWTRDDIPGASRHVQFLRQYDWTTSALGPMALWPWSLRQVLVTMMNDPDPRLLLWGPERVVLYNEACIALIGDKHPHALGKGPEDAFAEIWSQLSPMVSAAMNDGQPSQIRQMPLTMRRSGYDEETYWSFTMLPILGEDGHAAGVLDQFTESTDVVIAERRMGTVLEIGRRTTSVETLDDVWEGVLAGLDINIEDVPFAIVYSVIEESEFKHGRRSSAAELMSKNSEEPKTCVIRGVIGVEKENEAVFPSFNLSEGSEGYAVKCREAWEKKKPILLEAHDGSLPEQLAQGVPGRAGGLPCNRALVLSVPPTAGLGILGFIIIGISPRCGYDEEYKLFIRLLSDRLVTSAAAVSLPEEQRQAQSAAEEAALRHAQLSRQLVLRTQEAERNEAKFTRMAQNAPVGMFMIKSDLTPLYMNDEYYRITGRIRNDNGPGSWKSTVHPEDVSMLERYLRDALELKRPSTFEYRLKRRWTSTDDASGSELSGATWLMSTLFPELADDGSVQVIMGWVTDISLTKWTGELQKRQLEEALESKRQKENFIDITSHEVRNPLSAIIQSVDSIMMAVQDNDTAGLGADNSKEVIIDAAQTILLCAQHQKRIVDDILTLSKLDSQLLVIAPDRVEPRGLLQKVVRMYEGELQSADIEATISIDDSYETLSIGDVVIDPSRLLQVLINLLTNAIKFTRTSARRWITVSSTASLDRPTADPHGFTYIEQRAPSSGPVFASEWRDCPTVYLQFAVEDSGKGLTKEEMDLLFLRFSQASPKTYGNYGGSGLGLFISRELTELQGGQIGVASESGKGSTFAFYIIAKALKVDSKQTAPGLNVINASKPVIAKPQLPSEQRSQRPGYPFPHPPSSQDRESTINSVSGQTDPQAKKSISKSSDILHVLVVEDNIINQRVMAKQLRQQGMIVHVANNGIEALSFLERTPFSPSSTPSSALASPTSTPDSSLPLSLILLDQEMPVMGGIECIRKIREMERIGDLVGHVPVICVTANARHEQITYALGQGMDHVVTKPCRIPELVPQMWAVVDRLKSETERSDEGLQVNTGAKESGG